ncbi:MAG: c-type cytochrome [Pseudomonadota bacterium]
MRAGIAAAVLVAWGGSAPGAEVASPPYPERGVKGTVSAARLPVPPHPTLVRGGEVWDANCRICHGSGNFGAPKITGARFWAKRLEKGVATLVGHAQNGFETPLGGLMPARGGNEDLTDAEVEAAVRFMVFHSGGEAIALEGLDRPE